MVKEKMDEQQEQLPLQGLNIINNHYILNIYYILKSLTGYFSDMYTAIFPPFLQSDCRLWRKLAFLPFSQQENSSEIRLRICFYV